MKQTIITIITRITVTARIIITEIIYIDSQVGCEQLWRTNVVGPGLILAVRVVGT